MYYYLTYKIVQNLNLVYYTYKTARVVVYISYKFISQKLIKN